MKSSPHRYEHFCASAKSAHHKIFLLSAVIALLLALPCAALQREPNAPPKSTDAERKTALIAHELTATDLETFLDGLMPLSLERDDIAGAVVAVVKEGKLLFAKGYGLADVAGKKPVSPDNTLFRPGSISKLFTWTSVMQLVEQGKLNLDRDVNDYLDFKIPATYPQPITLRHIMTHTAGFGEAIKDLFINNASELQPLGAYLATHIPNRIFPPGTTPAYSNYATSLAGYIVERVSGKPFNDYVRDNILSPLGMEKTTFAQPLPDTLKPLMSSGYVLASGKARPFEIVQAWPAGSVSTAATDMARFMIAHLQNGEFNGARILRPETATLMHSRQFSANPALNGMALGFYEETRNGHRVIGHAGDTICFHSDLHLLLNDGVGFFVSYNSPGKGISNRTALWHKFLDRYFPYEIPAATPVATAVAHAREIAGSYISSRRPEGNVFEGLSLAGQTTVNAAPDGTITVSSLRDFAGQLKKFREIQPLVYQEINGQDRLAFQRDAGGRLNFAIDFPVFVFQRAGFLQLGSLNFLLLGASAGIMLLALLIWPVAALARRHHGTKLNLGKRARLLRVVVRLVCALDIVFLLSMFLVLTGLQQSLPTSHITGTIHFVQVIGLLGAIGTLIALYHAWNIWRSAAAPVLAKATAAATSTSGESIEAAAPVPARAQSVWWGTKVFETLIALACLGFVWFSIYWSMLNFSSNF